MNPVYLSEGFTHEECDRIIELESKLKLKNLVYNVILIDQDFVSLNIVGFMLPMNGCMRKWSPLS